MTTEHPATGTQQSNNDAPYFIGIDAGATKTNFILAADDRELARSTSPTIKLLRTTAEQADKNARAGLEELSAVSGVPLSAISSTCVGIAGVTVAAVRNGAEKILRRYLKGMLTLCGDIDIALDAAFPGDRGIVVIAGTGSNVAGRTADGSLVHAGGWGPVLGDQGSGYWFGHHALRRLMRVIDANESSVLLEAVLKIWNLKSIPELVGLANQTPQPDFSSLMPAIAQCAASGDSLCAELVQEGGELLADQVVLVAQKMAAEEGDLGQIKVAFTGSVLAQVPMVRDAMATTLAHRLPQALVLPCAIDPLQGALWRARRAWFSQHVA